MLGVPLCPKAAGAAVGPPTFHRGQIFWRDEGISGRTDQENSIFVRILLLFAHPIHYTFPLKPIPPTDQRLVPNVNDGININASIGISIGSCWDDTQKAVVRVRKATDDRTRPVLRYMVGRARVTGFDVFDQIAEPLRAAYRAPLLVCFGQRLKNPLSYAFKAGIQLGDLPENFIRVLGQRMLHTAYLRVVVDREMRTSIRVLRRAAECTFPAPHQSVLQDRQLIRIFVGVVQCALNKILIDLTPSTPDGFADDVFPLITGHPGHQKLALADGLGQAMKAGAIADKIGPHRQDDVYRHLRLRRGQKQANECRGLISTLGRRRRIENALRPKIRESKQFLELIDEQQNLTSLRSSYGRNLRQGFTDSEARLGKSTLETISPSFREIPGLAHQACQGQSQFPDGRIGWMHLDPLPLGIESRSQACADQGGFPGPGTADDGNETFLPNLRFE